MHHVLEAALCGVILSFDTFISAFAYGTNKIKIPFKSVLVINVVCILILSFSLLLGNLISPYISKDITAVFCFVILLVLGIVKLFDGLIKSYIKKLSIGSGNKEIKFSFFKLNFILNVYVDPIAADADKSHILSVGEAFMLSLALSLDSLAVGFSLAVYSAAIVFVVLFSAVFNCLAITTGAALGKKLAEKTRHSLSWLGGVLLIILALLKFLV